MNEGEFVWWGFFGAHRFSESRRHLRFAKDCYNPSIVPFTSSLSVLSFCNLSTHVYQLPVVVVVTVGFHTQHTSSMNSFPNPFAFADPRFIAAARAAEAAAATASSSTTRDRRRNKNGGGSSSSSSGGPLPPPPLGGPPHSHPQPLGPPPHAQYPQHPPQQGEEANEVANFLLQLKHRNATEAQLAAAAAAAHEDAERRMLFQQAHFHAAAAAAAQQQHQQQSQGYPPSMSSMSTMPSVPTMTPMGPIYGIHHPQQQPPPPAGPTQSHHHGLELRPTSFLDHTMMTTTHSNPMTYPTSSSASSSLPLLEDPTVILSDISWDALLDDSQLVFMKDRDLVPDALFLAMAQMRPCKLKQGDRVGCYKNRELGYVGMCCKHCGGEPGFGRFFPNSVRSLAQTTTSQTILKHIGYKCRFCPLQIRQIVLELQRQQAAKEGIASGRPRYGSRKIFFQRMWARLHGSKTDEFSTDDDEDSNCKVGVVDHDDYSDYPPPHHQHPTGNGDVDAKVADGGGDAEDNYEYDENSFDAVALGRRRQGEPKGQSKDPLIPTIESDTVPPPSPPQLSLSLPSSSPIQKRKAEEPATTSATTTTTTPSTEEDPMPQAKRACV